MTPTYESLIEADDLSTAKRRYLQARRNGATVRRALSYAAKEAGQQAAVEALWAIDPEIAEEIAP